VIEEAGATQGQTGIGYPPHNRIVKVMGERR